MIRIHTIEFLAEAYIFDIDFHPDAGCWRLLSGQIPLASRKARGHELSRFTKIDMFTLT